MDQEPLSSVQYRGNEYGMVLVLCTMCSLVTGSFVATGLVSAAFFIGMQRTLAERQARLQPNVLDKSLPTSLFYRLLSERTALLACFGLILAGIESMGLHIGFYLDPRWTFCLAGIYAFSALACFGISLSARRREDHTIR